MNEYNTNAALESLHLLMADINKEDPVQLSYLNLLQIISQSLEFSHKTGVDVDWRPDKFTMSLPLDTKKGKYVLELGVHLRKR